MERDVYGNLQEQVEHLQCETQADIKRDALILCQGMDSVPHFASHVIQGHFGICKEMGQPCVGDCTSLHASPSKQHQPLSKGGGSWPRIHSQKLCPT